MKEVFAKWRTAHVNIEIEDVHVSCGVGQDQYDGYSIGDSGARLTVEYTGMHYNVTFTAPSQALEKEADYWLSPCTLGHEEIEAYDFGIRERRER